MLIFFVASTMMAHSLALAETANWSEVATFTGLGNKQTQNTTIFKISYDEWRIRWMISLDPNYTLAAGFFVYVYPQGETKNYVGYFDSVGGSPANGTAYAHNLTGSFYLSVLAGTPGVLSYSLIVEQDLNSVPEFPPSTILPFALAIALLVTIALAYHKQRSKESELRSKTDFLMELPTSSSWKSGQEYVKQEQQIQILSKGDFKHE